MVKIFVFPSFILVYSTVSVVLWCRENVYSMGIIYITQRILKQKSNVGKSQRSRFEVFCENAVFLGENVMNCMNLEYFNKNNLGFCLLFFVVVFLLLTVFSKQIDENMTSCRWWLYLIQTLCGIIFVLYTKRVQCKELQNKCASPFSVHYFLFVELITLVSTPIFIQVYVRI